MGVILHVDMDAFYASVEAQRRNLKGEALVVCVYSGRTEDSGAVSTCSYEARELGINAAMPIKTAKKKAENSEKEVTFVGMDKKFYDQFSDDIKEDILEKYTETIEKASIDEFYLELDTEDFEESKKIAEEIQGSVTDNFDVTCSLGVAPNKLVAKIASDQKKPEGITSIEPEEVKDFMRGLELDEIHGIGAKTVEKLNELGINSVGDLAEADPALLVREFGEKKGLKLREKARGEDDSEVEETLQKQVTRITTLEENSREINRIKKVFPELASDIVERLEEKDMDFGSVSLIFIDTEIEMSTRANTLKSRVRDEEVLIDEGEKLLEEFLDNSDAIVRRVGLRASDLKKRRGQKSMEEFT